MLRQRHQFKGEKGVGKTENEIGEAGMLNTTNTDCRK